MPETSNEKIAGAAAGLKLSGAVLIAAVAILMYAPVIHHEFVYDDFLLVKENTDIRDIGADGIRHIFFGTDYQNYLPLRALAYALIRHYAGDDPAPFHIVNIIFHAANSILVFLLAWSLLNRAGPGGGSKKIFAASLIAGILFAAHPLHIEAVTWVSGFKELLSTFFCLLALLVYLRYRSRGMALGYPLLIVFFAAALLSKATALFLPLAFVLFDITFPGDARRTPAPHRLAEHAFIFLLAAGCAILNFSLASQKQMITAPMGGGAAMHIATILKIIPFYLKMSVWPWPLSVIYDVPTAKAFFDPAVMASTGALLALAGLFFFSRKRNQAAAFGLGFFAISLAPTLNVVPFGTLVADRYAYFPLFGLCLAAGAAAGRIAASGLPARLAVSAGLALLLALYFNIAHARNEEWKNSVSLWEATIRTTPGSAKAHMNLGVSYLDTNRMDDAFRQLQAARTLDPYMPKAYVGLSLYYRKMNMPDKAYETLQEGWRRTPGELELEYNFGIVLFEQQNFIRAANMFFIVETVFPNYKNNRRYLEATLEELRKTLPPEDFDRFIESVKSDIAKRKETASGE